MKNESKLENGLIPKYTKCPYSYECGDDGGNCHHKGTYHNVSFSCAFARLFDLIHVNSKDEQ